MRIYNRVEFMKLPEGTLYVKGSPHAYGNSLCVKGETLQDMDGKDSDWFHRDLTEVEAQRSDQAMDRMDEMLEKGASYPVSAGTGRDGCFDPNDTFLVYEKADLDEMMQVLHRAGGEFDEIRAQADAAFDRAKASCR